MKNFSNYRKEAFIDEFGNDNTEYSLTKIIQQQPDFIKEINLLQHTAKELGSEVDRTPKFHPELADEGIDYIWENQKKL